jgi:formate dehydrogenase subunit gamma
MKTGYVSEEWARQHHDLWHDKQVAKGKLLDSETRQKHAQDTAPAGASTAHATPARS